MQYSSEHSGSLQGRMRPCGACAERNVGLFAVSSGPFPGEGGGKGRGAMSVDVRLNACDTSTLSPSVGCVHYPGLHLVDTYIF